MGEIVNLNRVKKRRARATAEAQAAANRLRFGRTAAGKAADTVAEARRRTQLDNHRQEEPKP